MTTKRDDYTASAVNLVNPPDVGLLLLGLRQAKRELKALEDTLQANNTKLFGQIEELQSDINWTTDRIKEGIEKNGSYQDIEAGEYAVKQRRVSKSYDPKKFKDLYPRFAPAVIIETVDVKVLQILQKGGQIDEDVLREAGVTIEKETYAYIIKVIEGLDVKKEESNEPDRQVEPTDSRVGVA